MGEAVAFLERQANALPAEFSHDWQGDSRQYTQEGSALAFAFLAALVIIYLVLAAQYESLKDPLIIPHHRAAVDLRRLIAAGAGLRHDEYLYPGRAGDPDRAD